MLYPNNILKLIIFFYFSTSVCSTRSIKVVRRIWSLLGVKNWGSVVLSKYGKSKGCLRDNKFSLLNIICSRINLLCYFSEGCKHDAAMLADFGLLNDLGRFAFSPTRAPMRVYGDPAYPLRTLLQGQFRRAHLTLLMKAYNTATSTVRTSRPSPSLSQNEHITGIGDYVFFQVITTLSCTMIL